MSRATHVSFISKGRRIILAISEIAYTHQSIVDNHVQYIDLHNGDHIRAENLTELTIDVNDSSKNEVLAGVLLNY